MYTYAINNYYNCAFQRNEYPIVIRLLLYARTYRVSRENLIRLAMIYTNKDYNKRNSITKINICNIESSWNNLYIMYIHTDVL
jgi:hypothetical protein